MSTFKECPDCGQPRTGEECEICKRIAELRVLWDAENKDASWGQYYDGLLLLFAFDFQKARAEKAETEVERLRGAIEKHRENENKQRGTHPFAHLDRDIELWAALEGGEVEE